MYCPVLYCLSFREADTFKVYLAHGHNFHTECVFVCVRVAMGVMCHQLLRGLVPNDVIYKS